MDAISEADALPLDLVENGRGDSVVLVHGSASDQRTWSELLPRLADDHRAVAYSRRFHWPNPSIPQGVDYSMREHVEDLAEILRAQPEGAAHLVGHSYGAMVCLFEAILHPELVRSMVLIEPPALTLFVSNRPRPIELLRLLVTRPRTALAIMRLGVEGFGPATAAVEEGRRDDALEAFGSAVLGRDAFQALSPERLERAKANFIDAELTGSGLPKLPASCVRDIRVPVLLVCGDRSPRVFHRFADGLEELLPSVRRVQIAPASHIVQEDAPEALGDAILRFLADVKP